MIFSHQPQTDFNPSPLVKKLEWEIAARIGLFSHGGYRSVWKGKGLNFAEVRDYNYGDDIKDIDWNVTARFGHPFVKLFNEERETDVWLIADISASMDFGLPGRPKKHLLWELVTLIALLAEKQKDKVGLITFGAKNNLFIPPRKGKRAIHSMLHRLVRLPADYRGAKKNFFWQQLLKSSKEIKKEGEIIEEAKWFHFVRSIKKRSVIFFISDFLFPTTLHNFHYIQSKHESFWLHIKDPLEEGVQASVAMEMIDMETGKTQIFNHSDGVELDESLQEFFSGLIHRGRYLSLYTTDAFDKKIFQFFSRRRLV